MEGSNALDGDYLTGSIPNVNRDYMLVGYWTWVPNSQYQLSYFGGDNTTCWIPTKTSKVPDSSSHYQDSNVTVAGALTAIPMRLFQRSTALQCPAIIWN